MRTIKYLVLSAGAAVLLSSIAGYAMGKKQSAPATLQPIDVLVSSAQEQKIPLVLTAFGHMEAMQAVDLSFSVNGHVTQIYAHSGQRVEKGQAIMQLDDASDVAQLRSLQANLELQQSTYKRMLELEKYGGVSPQVVDQNRAELVSAEANVQQQQALIAQKKLIAPFTGVLGIFNYDVGAYVPQGTAVVRLVQQAPLNVLYSVPSTYKSQIEIGQTIEVASNVYPGKIFSGILNFISPEVNVNSGTVTLQAKVDNPDYLLSPGMFVNVTQVLDPNRQLLMVPDVALMTDVTGQYVFKVMGDHVQQQYVNVGVIAKDMAEITSGLQLGDQVVTAGQQKLSDGSLINIINPVPPTAPTTETNAPNTTPVAATPKAASPASSS